MTICFVCWGIALNKTGEKGMRVGELLAERLQETHFPGKKVIVHHYTNYSDRVQVELEIRTPDHKHAEVKRIFI